VEVYKKLENKLQAYLKRQNEQ